MIKKSYPDFQRRDTSSGAEFASGSLPIQTRSKTMPRGDKSSYTGKQKRQAEHIEKGYENRGVSKKEAERRAWATENKISHGGKKSGSGRGKSEDHSPNKRGGEKGGRASKARAKSSRRGASVR
jgi:plasmid stabilization system protein ParE